MRAVHQSLQAPRWARGFLLGATGAVLLAVAPASASAGFTQTQAESECIIQQRWETTSSGTRYINVDKGACFIELTITYTPDVCPPDPTAIGGDGAGFYGYVYRNRYYKPTDFSESQLAEHVSGDRGQTKTSRTSLGVSPQYDDLFNEVNGERVVGTDLWKFRVGCADGSAAESGTKGITIIVRGPNYAPPPGGGGGGGPPSSPPSVSAEQIRRLRQAVNALKAQKRALEDQRKEMQEAIEELEAKNEVFCGTAGSLSMLTGLHKFQWNGAHVLPHTVVEELSLHALCAHIPDVVKGYVDADRKLARNSELIRRLGEQIKRIERELQRFGATISVSSRRSPTLYPWPATLRTGSGADTYQSGTDARNPLAALKSGRNQTLAVMRTLSDAIGKGELDRAKGLAQSAASSLAALPATCSQAKRYLRKSGLGKRFSRARILGALRRLKAGPLPRPVLAFAKAFHLTRAKMKRLIRKAKTVPRSRIKAMAASDLVCSPRLDAIDNSLAAAFRKLAEAL